MSDARPFRAPNALERLMNRLIGRLAGLGLVPRHVHLVEVRGRRTGRPHATPVDVLDAGGRRWLVAPRGAAQWVRNVEASGELTLRRGRVARRYRARPLADAEKPPVLAAYLDRFRLEVQRYFPVRAGSPPAAFVPLAACYPVFELTEDDRGAAAERWGVAVSGATARRPGPAARRSGAGPWGRA